MNKNLVSITDFSKEEILQVLDMAQECERNPYQPHVLNGKVVASVFFEPSTRTRLSFESAINRLGGKVIGFADASNTSVTKGETLKDSVMMIANFAELIIMRHPVEGSARYASEISRVPVINAGDGANQHPSQTILDLYSIKKTQGRLDGLTITIVGDLKYGRTVHSLIMAMSHFNTTFKFIAPPELRLPKEQRIFLQQKKLCYSEHTELAENITDADIIYMTRVQRERFSDPIEYEKVKNVYVLKKEMLNHTKDNVKIMHPLPRVNEIDLDVDESPKAYYFNQAENGVYTRMAIISYIMNCKQQAKNGEA